MCNVCRQYPCHPRCPNAPEPELECAECGCGIYAGDKYLDSGGGAYCIWCLEEKTPEELLGLVGKSMSFA